MQSLYYYAAGIFDGEGSISYSKRKLSNNRICARVRVAAYNQYPEVLQCFVDLFGGKIYKNDQREKQAVFVWACGGSRAMKAMKALYPYMKEPVKRRKIEFVLERYPGLPTSRPYTDEVEAVHLAFINEFSQIKDTYNRENLPSFCSAVPGEPVPLTAV
jgi:hypothetical protein